MRHCIFFVWISSTKWRRMPVNGLYVSINYKLLPVNCGKKGNHPHLALSTVHISAGSEAYIMWWLKEPIAWQHFNQNLHYLLLIWVTKLAINQLKKMLSLMSLLLAVSSLHFFIFFLCSCTSRITRVFKFFLCVCLSTINTLFLINCLVHCEGLCCSLAVWDTSLYCAHRGESIGDRAVLRGLMLFSTVHSFVFHVVYALFFS